jgi:hypothetical protein
MELKILARFPKPPGRRKAARQGLAFKSDDASPERAGATPMVHYLNRWFEK